MEIWMCNSGWLHAPSSGAGCSFHLKTTFRLKSKNPNAKTLLGLNYIFPGNLFIPNFIPQKQGLLVTAAEENARRYFYILFGCKTCLPSRFSLRIEFFRWENPTWAEPTASSLSVKLQNSCISIFSFFSLALFVLCICWCGEISSSYMSEWASHATHSRLKNLSRAEERETIGNFSVIWRRKINLTSANKG